MTPDEARAVLQRLTELKDQLVAEGAVEVRVEQDEAVASALDEDDAPYREMGQSIASARNRERAERLDQIDDALRRLRDDPEGYGRCESCDEPIPPRRLALLPFARWCVECQSSRESRGSPVRKKVTDYR